MTRLFAHLLPICLIPMLASCGGGGGASSSAAEPRVMRVEIEQTGLLMTASGESRTLKARAFDEQGRELAVPITWSSTAPDDVFVGPDTGVVVAQISNGSAQIVAAARGRSSAPLLAVVTPLGPNVVPVDDTQVVRGAQDSDPLAAPSPTNTYTVILDGTRTPIVGERLVSTGSDAIAGEVVAVEPVAEGSLVTLRLVPLRELMPQLNLDLVMDLSEAAIELAPEIAQRYTMERDGGRVILTPLPASTAVASKAVASKVATPAGTFAFDRGCEVALVGSEDNSLPLTFKVLPAFDVAINPSLDVQFIEGGQQHVIVRAAPRIVLDAELFTTLAFQGKVECKAELFRIRLPVGGAFSFVLGGLIPVGFGVELAGKVTVAEVAMGYRSTTTGTLAAGLDCTADCEVIADVSISNQSEPRLTPPEGEFGDGLTFEPSLFGFAFAEVVFGNPFIRSLQFNALVGKFGAKFEGDFGSMDTQIADPVYASTYGIKVACELGPDLDLNSAVQLLFGSAAFIPKKFECDFDPFTQLPKLTSAVASRSSWVEGDEVEVDVRFDPTSLDFIPGIGLENLSTVQLIRRDASGRSTVIASSIGAIPGEVRLRFLSLETPNGAFRAGTTDELFIAYFTALLPFSSLRIEAGKVTGNKPPVATPDSITVAANSGRTPIPVLANDEDPDGGVLRVESTTLASNGGAFLTPDGAVEYQPNPDFVGTDSFTYTVVDERGATATANVSVTVGSSSGRIGFDGASINASGGATACKDETIEACRFSQPPNGATFVESSFVASDRDSGGAGGSQSVSGSATGEDGDQAAAVTGSATLSASGAGNVRTFTASCNFFAEVTEEVVQADKSDASGSGTVSFTLDLPAGSSFSVALSGVTATASDPAYSSAATVRVRFRSDAADGYSFEQSAAGVLSNNGTTSGMAEGEGSFSLNCSTFPVNNLSAGQVRSQATATLTVTAPP